MDELPGGLLRELKLFHLCEERSDEAISARLIPNKEIAALVGLVTARKARLPVGNARRVQ